MHFELISTAFQSHLAYRSQLWAAIFGQIVHVFARVAIWSAIFSQQAVTGGVTLADMTTYAILSGTMLAAWNFGGLIGEIGRSLKTGDIAVFLLKPIHYPLYLLSTEVGNLAYRTTAIVVPVTVVVSLTYGFQPPASGFHGVLFAVYWLLSFAILFLVACICGLLAFWLMTAFSLEWLLFSLLTVLSGSFIPFWFFPEPLGSIAKHLPFAWVGYYPAAIYLGKMEVAACAGYFALGVVWTLLLSAGVALLWRKASRRITIQGG